MEINVLFNEAQPESIWYEKKIVRERTKNRFFTIIWYGKFYFVSSQNIDEKEYF